MVECNIVNKNMLTNAVRMDVMISVVEKTKLSAKIKTVAADHPFITNVARTNKLLVSFQERIHITFYIFEA